jgi:hypothetical protein
VSINIDKSFMPYNKNILGHMSDPELAVIERWAYSVPKKCSIFAHFDGDSTIIRYLALDIFAEVISTDFFL